MIQKVAALTLQSDPILRISMKEELVSVTVLEVKRYVGSQGHIHSEDTERSSYSIYMLLSERNNSCAFVLTKALFHLLS